MRRRAADERQRRKPPLGAGPHPQDIMLLNVESAYGPIKAIRGVSLKVRRGEIATVLGSNGAGKTTILKTISASSTRARGTVFRARTSPPGPGAHRAAGLSHVPEGARCFRCCRCTTTC